MNMRLWDRVYHSSATTARRRAWHGWFDQEQLKAAEAAERRYKKIERRYLDPYRVIIGTATS
jgi:hypothetical protein